MAKVDEEQVALGRRLQKLLLSNYERLFTSGEPTAADRAALQKLLSQNGWSIDPDDVPQNLKQYLPTNVDPSKFDDDDADLEVN